MCKIEQGVWKDVVEASKNRRHDSRFIHNDDGDKHSESEGLTSKESFCHKVLMRKLCFGVKQR